MPELAARRDGGRRGQLKVCGATRVEDVALLAAAGADFVGLWHGVPGGHAELTAGELETLAGAALATGQLRPMLVTLQHDVDSVLRAVASSRTRWVQLHGYQQPGMVRALKAAAGEGLTVVKVLHVRDGVCLERPLIRAYERAGVDLFLLDTVTADGRIGSTAQALDPLAVLEIAELVTRPLVLAGGLSETNADRFRQVSAHPRFFGIDVDTGARHPDRRFDPVRIAGIRRSWTVGSSH